MANLRQIKGKIRSVGNLKKITRALEVVSTVKLQKVKTQAEQIKGYILDVLAIVSQVADILDVFEPERPVLEENKRTLAIVVTSERGLAGGLNSKLLREMTQNHAHDKQVDYFVIGKKGLEYLKRIGASIVGTISLSDALKETELLPLYAFFDKAMASRQYDEIQLYFNFFKNSIVQIPVGLPLYPLTKATFDEFVEKLDIVYTMHIEVWTQDLLVEPTKEVLVAEMKRQIRNYLIAAAVIQNKAGEHAARMLAMKNATDNATSFVKSLTLSFNKARQGAITQEISEIVSAKIAIESA